MTTVNEFLARRTLYNYAAHLATQLQILDLEYNKHYFNGRYCEWLREYRPTIDVIRELTLIIVEEGIPISKTNPFSQLRDVLIKIFYSQGQQKTLPIVRRMAENAFEAMCNDNWGSK